MKLVIQLVRILFYQFTKMLGKNENLCDSHTLESISFAIKKITSLLVNYT